MDPQQPGQSPYAQSPYSQSQYDQSQYGQPQYAAPLPAMNPREERSWATAAHAVPGAAFVLSAGFLGFIASLVIYLVHKDRGPFVRQHAVNSLNVQLTFLVYAVVSAILMFVLIGFATMAAAYVYVVLCHVMGAMKAWKGEPYRPPVTISFLR